MADSSEINSSETNSEISSISAFDPDRKAPIWAHTRKPYPNEVQNYWDTKYKRNLTMRYCKYCKNSTSTKAHVPTNFRRHLLSEHGITADVTPRKVKQNTNKRASYLDKVFGTSQDLKAAFKSGRTIEEIAEAIFESYLTENKAKLKRALVEFIVRNKVPFHMVENSALGTLLLCFNPSANKVLPTSHNTIASYTMESFKDQKKLVQQLLKTSYTRIHLAADIWKSPNSYDALGITAKFIKIDNEKPRRMEVLLGLQEVAGHSGENQFHVIAPLLEEFNIERNCGCVMGDNSGTNDTLCRSLASWFDSLKTTPTWDAQEMRGRCLGHMINLIVKSFLTNKVIVEEEKEEEDLIWIVITAASFEETQDQEKEKGKKAGKKKKTTTKLEPIFVLAKLHAIVHHMHSSSGHANEFRSLAGRLVPQDNATRWNSWFSMIQVACKHQEAISKYTLNNSNDLRDKFLTDEDWEELHAIEDFLEMFHEATLRAEGEHGSIGHTLVLLDLLYDCVVDKMVRNIPFPLT